VQQGVAVARRSVKGNYRDELHMAAHGVSKKFLMKQDSTGT
jgi:hypothetical protein